MSLFSSASRYPAVHMTISLSQQSYTDFEQALYAQAQYPDSTDSMDLLLQQPAWFATGYTREVELRQGLRLQILDFRLCDRCETTLPDQEGAISFHFHLSGEHQDACTEVSNLEYALYGSGLAPKHTLISPDRYPALEVIVEMEPESFVSFIGSKQNSFCLKLFQAAALPGLAAIAL